jgi:hypothetical protein
MVVIMIEFFHRCHQYLQEKDKANGSNVNTFDSYLGGVHLNLYQDTEYLDWEKN